MEEKEIYNSVTIREKDGIANIKIDGTEIKAINFYEIKRDTDIANLTISISVSPSKLKFVEN